MQLPLWAPESSWQPPDISTLPSWEGAKRIGIDTETRDPSLRQLGIGVRRGGYAVGFSFSIEDGPSHYLPIRHLGGGNLDERAVLGYLRQNAARFRGIVAGANLAYDLDYWWEEEIHFHSDAQYCDIQVADPLIYELYDSYSLDNIARRWGLPGKDQDLLIRAAQAHGLDPKRDMWKLNSQYVGPYAIADAAQPLLTLRRQERAIEEKELGEIWDLECAVLPVLVRMRRRGVRVNEEKLAGVEQWSLEQEAKALQKVETLSGCRVGLGDVWKPDAVARPLEAIGVQLNKTSTGKPSVDKELLSRIDHPVADALQWARKVNKLRTTFAASLRTYMCNGRIHCTFNQIARESEKGGQKGVRYGRLSATDPNLQQQPSRDEFADRWRDVYEPEEGSLWASNDYSQQEPRWTTHFAALAKLRGAQDAARAYRENPDLDNHDFMTKLIYGINRADNEELFEKNRKHAKIVFLGLCYGEGGGTMCEGLGLPTRWAMSWGRGRARRLEFFPTHQEALAAVREVEHGFVYKVAGEEGQEILDQFDARAPYVRELSKMARDRAEDRGYIITGGGRRLHFPQMSNGRYDYTKNSLNRLIQGTSADQMKRALIEIDRAGHFLQLQVHDESNCSVASEEEALAIGGIMRDVMPALVPFKVDTEVGESWGNQQKL